MVEGFRLQLLRDTWQLDDDTLAEMCGTSTEQTQQWLRDGVPTDRAATVAPLVEAAEHLSSRLRVAQIPAAVRRPAATLDGRSVVDVAGDDPQQARDYVTSMYL